MELDEGMFYLGLQAAAQRVPFLPTRAGLGSDVLARQPRPADGALPLRCRQPLLPTRPTPRSWWPCRPSARRRLRARQPGRRRGNGQILGPDPFFDELFLGAADAPLRDHRADRRTTGALADGTPPATVHRPPLLTDGVAEIPGGAHFTACPPDYGRDEAFQKEYAAAAGDPDAWAAFAAALPAVDEPTTR